MSVEKFIPEIVFFFQVSYSLTSYDLIMTTVARSPQKNITRH